MSPPRLPQFPHLRRAGLVGPLGPRVPGLRCTASDRAAGQGSGGRRWHRLPSAACPRSGPPPRTPASPAAPFHSAPSPHLRRPIPALPPHLRRPPPSHSRAPPTCGTHHPPPPPTHLQLPARRARWHTQDTERCSPTMQAARPTRSPWRRRDGVPEAPSRAESARSRGENGALAHGAPAPAAKSQPGLRRRLWPPVRASGGRTKGTRVP